MRASGSDGDALRPARGPESSGAARNGDAMPALEALLRDERAAVAVMVALANSATTYSDRTQLERLGGELVLLCAALRERLDLAGRAVPGGASPQAGEMLATESYDARLTALADFLDATAAHATTALTDSDEDTYTRTLRDLIPAHAQAARWLRERAAAFAATRPLDQPPDAASMEIATPETTYPGEAGTATDMAQDGEAPSADGGT